MVAVLLAGGASAGFGQAGARRGALDLRPEGTPPKATPKAGANRGPRLTNPGSPAARLYRATPDQRARAIEKLPQLQQERIQRNLEWFDSLPKEDQEIVIRRTERYSALSPEKRRAFLLQLQSLNRMPPLRRQAIRAALLRLQRLSDERRAAILESPDFRSRFDAEEQKIISDLSEVMVPAATLP